MTLLSTHSQLLGLVTFAKIHSHVRFEKPTQFFFETLQKAGSCLSQFDKKNWGH